MSKTNNGKNTGPFETCITMRDFFASYALTGELSSERNWCPVDNTELADRCYEMADEMIRRRNQPEVLPAEGPCP